MVISKLWDNSYTRLFLLDDEDVFYLRCVGITGVHWTRTTERTCLYCGQKMESFICSGCGSTSPHRIDESGRLGIYLGRASVGLVGILPHFKLFNFVDGMRLDVVYGRASRPDIYVPEDVIFRFRDCVMDTVKIGNLVVLEPEDCGVLKAHLRLVADVMMVWENWGLS